MSFTRAKPAGWATLEQITPAQINQIDTNQSNAIDGAAGGDYAPTNPIGLSNDLEIKSGADLVLESGARAVVQSGAELRVESGGDLRALSGSTFAAATTLNMEAGSDIELATGVEVFSTNAREGIVPLHTDTPGYFNTAAETYVTGPIDWGMTVDGVLIQHQRTSATEWIILNVPALPAQATITGFQVYIKPVAGHAALPGTPPAVRLVRYNGGVGVDGGRSVISTVTDAVAVGVYNTTHDLTATGLSEFVGTSGAIGRRRYRLEIRGEYGADSANDMLILCAQVTYTATRVNHQHHEITLA